MIEFISLVSQLSKDDFDDVRIENSEQIPLFYNDKTGRLDIKIRLNDGRKIDVEMSFSDRHPCLSENTSFAIRQNIAAAKTSGIRAASETELCKKHTYPAFILE